MRGSQPGGTDQNQQLIKLRDESKAVGHGVTVSEIHIDPNESFRHLFVPDLLGGLVVLEGKAKRIYGLHPATELYYETGSEVIEAVDIKMIPYYAWYNRGVPQMSVWLPRA